MEVEEEVKLLRGRGRRSGALLCAALCCAVQCGATGAVAGQPEVIHNKQAKCCIVVVRCARTLMSRPRRSYIYLLRLSSIRIAGTLKVGWSVPLTSRRMVCVGFASASKDWFCSQQQLFQQIGAGIMERCAA